MQTQTVLPGCEDYFASAWKPSADDPGPRRLLDLLQWFARTCQDVFPSLEYIRASLKVSKRTVKRWLAALREAGKVHTQRRGPRSLRFVICETPASLKLEQFSNKEANRKEGPKPGPPGWWKRHMEPLLRRAAVRIGRAKNPAAYRQAIISSELAQFRPAKEVPEPVLLQRGDGLSFERWRAAGRGNDFDAFLAWATRP